MSIAPTPLRWNAEEPAAPFRAYVESLFGVVATTIVGLLIAPLWGNSPVDLLYLVPVIVSARYHGLWPATMAALVSALAFNFFFTEPVRTFRIHSPADIVTVVVLLGVALVVSRLVAAMRAQARAAVANARRNATIAGLAGRLLTCVDEEEIGATSCATLAPLFDCNAVLMIARDGQPQRIAGSPVAIALTPSDIGAAALAIAQGQIVGRGSPRLSPADWLFYPVKSGGKVLAAMGLARDDGRAPVGDEQLPLLMNLLDTTALALERERLEREVQDVASLRERDRLRGALLSSVGHDLRTPLTAIHAAAAELRQAGDATELADTIEAESAKLGRYIANLLDMARIEAGAIRLHEEPVDLVDAVGAATRDLKQGLASHEIEIDLPPELPLVRTDPHLLHHCLLNLIDNAARYAGPGSSIRIAGEDRDSGVTLSITDEGPGLPDPPSQLFDRFQRIAGSDREGGAGLGLAIVKGFADAMGVGIEARNNQPRGATIALHFPQRLVVSEERLGNGAQTADR